MTNGGDLMVQLVQTELWPATLREARALLRGDDAAR